MQAGPHGFHIVAPFHFLETLLSSGIFHDEPNQDVVCKLPHLFFGGNYFLVISSHYQNLFSRLNLGMPKVLGQDFRRIKSFFISRNFAFQLSRLFLVENLLFPESTGRLFTFDRNLSVCYTIPEEFSLGSTFMLQLDRVESILFTLRNQ